MIYNFFRLLLLATLTLTGCQMQPNKQRPNRLSLNLQEGEPVSFNPYVGIDLRSRCLYLALFEPLMRRGSDGKLAFAAAEKVEIDATKTVYTFHLRDHLWSNKEPVTSYHFANAWRYALKPGSLSSRSDLLYPILNAKAVKEGKLPLQTLGIETPDAKTLVVTLTHPTPYFLDLAATSFYLPLYHPSQEEPRYFNGPYLLGEKIPDQQLVFKRNPTYWDASAVQLEEINFSMVRDPTTALALFEKGMLDLVGDPFSTLPLDVIPSFEKTGLLHHQPISRLFYLLLNTESLPLSNTKFRKALAFSVNREQVAHHLFFGEIPTLTLVPSTLSLLDSSELIQEDPLQLFEEALQELGMTREELPTLVFSYAELSGQKKLAEFIQEQWQKKLGIRIQLSCTEWNVHSAQLKKGNYQIGTLHLTTLYQDPMFYFDLFRDKSSPTNYCRWENPHFQALLEQAESTKDIATRSAALKEAEKFLLEEMPAINVFTQQFQYLMRENVHLEMSDLGIYDLKSARAL